MNPEQIVEFLIREWQTLKAAPMTFIMLTVLALGAAVLVVTWLFNAQIQTLHQRLAYKEDILAEYRERLHLVPTDQTKFSKLTNLELRAQVSALVTAIRAFHASVEDSSRETSFAQMEEMRPAKSKEERIQIWNRFTQLSIETFSEHQQRYINQFATKSIVLRDELLSRLPATVRDKKLDHWYEQPNYHWSSIKVSTDLDRLAHLLP